MRPDSRVEDLGPSGGTLETWRSNPGQRLQNTELPRLEEVYSFRFIVGHIIPKSVKCIHSATQVQGVLNHEVGKTIQLKPDGKSNVTCGKTTEAPTNRSLRPSSKARGDLALCCAHAGDVETTLAYQTLRFCRFLL